MGLLLGHHINSPVPVTGVVTVSGEHVDDFGINREGRAVIVFRQDGTVDKIVNATPTQIDVSTDWIIPNNAAPSNYEIRYTGLTGDPLDASTSAAENIWRQVTLGDYFFEQRAPNNLDNFESTITIEVRKGSSGGALDSATYVIHASRNNI